MIPHSIWILYILWRFWCLFVEGPDYVKSPSFIAGYTEGMGRPRRAKTKKKKPRKSPINFKVIRIKGHEFELKYLVKEIAAVVIGLWMLLTWGIGTVEGLIRKSWPTTQGIILTAKTETDTLYTDQKHVRLTYKYHVDGKQYMGKNIKADEGLPHKPEKAEELLRTTYRVSQPVTVYYKSKNPAVSVLEPGPEVYHYILSGLGIFFLYMGASIIYGSITDRIRREENT